MLTPPGGCLPSTASPERCVPGQLRYERSVTLGERSLSLRLLECAHATAAQFRQAKNPFPRREGHRCSLGARHEPGCSPPWRRDAPHELSARPDARQELTGVASFAPPEGFAPPPPEPFHEQTPSQPTSPRRHEAEHGSFRERILERPRPAHPPQSRVKRPLRSRARESWPSCPQCVPPAEQQPGAAPAGTRQRPTAAAAREDAAHPGVFPLRDSIWRDSADRFPHLRPDCELPD